MTIATELPLTDTDASLEFERDFAVRRPHVACQRLAAGWLWLSVSALVGAGVFALLVVLARTPYVSSVFPTVDFFRSALVVHVDMSVLFWFFAFAGSCGAPRPRQSESGSVGLGCCSQPAGHW